MASKSSPNPLFAKWLTEWKNGARDVASKMEFVYGKALKSLRECPDVLSSGEECRQLKGFGDKLCKRIDDRLRQHRIETGEHVDRQSDDIDIIGGQTVFTSIMSPRSNKSKELCSYYKMKKRSFAKLTPNKTISPLRKVAKIRNKKSNYIPAEGSGAYAILLALFKHEMEDNIDSMVKEELQRAAQEFATNSMTASLPGMHYNAFSSVKTLINKNLIEKTAQRYSSYYLTEEGREVASKLYQIYNNQRKNITNTNKNNTNNRNYDEVIIESDDEDESENERRVTPNQELGTQCSQMSTQNASGEQFSLRADSFEIVLCIDSREQATGVDKNMRKTALMSALQQNEVKVEMRTLAVGDFAWIAKERLPMGSHISTAFNRQRKELILDMIVERKRIDDLASSIVDRRWDEQKYRLRNCGLRRPTYLIEYFGSSRTEYRGLKSDTLEQAIANAEIDGYSVQRCDSYEDTIRYLTLTTRYLESFFRSKTIKSCTKEELINREAVANQYMTFGEFSRNATKINNFTVTEMFAKHLLQIRGISVSKAKVIIEHYPTLQSLLDAYSLTDNEKEKSNLLSSLKAGLMGRNFGPVISKKIYQHYSR